MTIVAIVAVADMQAANAALDAAGFGHKNFSVSAHPSTYPALIRQVREPRSRLPWKQPIDQYDAYKLVNPFTGKADECTINGNTWSPTAYPAGWQLVP